MRCLRCSSPRILKFIDGFGLKRVFCRDCWLSIPESNLKLDLQKNLNQFSFKADLYGEDWRNKYKFA